MGDNMNVFLVRIAVSAIMFIVVIMGIRMSLTNYAESLRKRNLFFCDMIIKSYCTITSMVRQKTFLKMENNGPDPCKVQEDIKFVDYMGIDEQDIENRLFFLLRSRK